MRRFGVEIEVGLLPGHSKRMVELALAEAGLGGRAQGYMGHDEHLWVVKIDGSVPNGVEVVSPPLDFDNEDARGQVTRAIEAIRPHCRPVAEGGIHVHVESSDLTARQVAGVARVFAHFEDVIYRIASSGWNTIRPGARQYARPLSEPQKNALARARTDDAVRSAYYGRNNVAFVGGHGDSSRYFGLNLHSHFYRGTIEFRVFNSSLNAKRVQTYIAVCMALVQDARNGHMRSVNKACRLGEMAAGTKDAAKVFFRFLTVVRYEAGMSLDDYRNLKAIWKDSRAQQSIPTYY